MRPEPEDRGSVLALAVLVLVALQLLAHGVLLMAQAEIAASRTGLRLLQARAAADAGAIHAEEGSSPAWDSIPLFGSGSHVAGDLGGHPFGGRVQRLTREYWLAEGRGRSRGERWEVTARRLVWRLDPTARIAEVEGAVEVGGALPEAAVVSLDAEIPAFCGPWRAVLDSVVSSGTWGRAARITPAAEGAPSLGRLGAADLAALLPLLAAPVVQPKPVVRLGRCEAHAPWNWGDPVDPRGPCGDVLVALVAPGDLRMETGVGQGILAVAGDLEVHGGRFDGVLLVGGSLTLLQGAEVRGLVGVGRDLRAAEGSRILGSPCRALRALDRFRAELARPEPVPEAGGFEEGQ